MAVKDMNRSNWSRVRSKQQLIRTFTRGDQRGKISLLKITEITEPLILHNGERELVLADVGYYWLQLAVDQARAWFTAMYDDQGRFLELYVDVTDGNNALQENPCFDDMYLDYVVSAQKVIELDRNELEDAFAAGVISRTQYENALTAGAAIYRDLTTNREQIKGFFADQFAVLRAELERAQFCALKTEGGRHKA